jgi:hypothetical protein
VATCLELYGYDADWDTGICTYCDREMDDIQRTAAVNHVVHFGWDGYMHQWCFDFNYPVFMTAEQVRRRWYPTHPELWND